MAITILGRENAEAWSTAVAKVCDGDVFFAPEYVAANASRKRPASSSITSSPAARAFLSFFATSYRDRARSSGPSPRRSTTTTLCWNETSTGGGTRSRWFS